MMRMLLELAGKKYNFLTVLRKDPRPGRTGHWICRCDCGKLKSIKGSSINSGKTKSCGCYKSSCASARAKEQVRKKREERNREYEIRLAKRIVEKAEKKREKDPKYDESIKKSRFEEITELAASLGMTYGQYQAQEYLKTHKIIKG